MQLRNRLWVELRLWLKGLLMVAVPLAPLALLAISVRSLQSEQRRAIERLRLTVQVYREVQAVRFAMMSAESSVSAYLLQGRESALEPYKAARISVPARLSNLENLLGGEGAQFKRLERVQPLIERHLSLLTNLRRYASIPGVSHLPPPPELLAETRAILGQVQSILGEIQRDEDARLERASEQALRAQNRTDFALLASLAFVLFGGIVSVWLLMASISKSERRRAEEAFQDSQRQLRDLLKGAESQVAELANSEKVLRYQTGLLHSVLRSMSDGVAVTGEDGGLLLANDAAGRILDGLQSTHSAKWVARYGLCLPDGITPYPAAEFPLARALRGEEVDQAVLFAAKVREPEGAWISLTARPIRDDAGSVKGCVAVLTDITALKRNERVLVRSKEEAERARDQAEAGNQAKGEFLSRLSQEIRTSLNAMLGFTQLVGITPLGPAQKESVEQIAKSGRSLLAVLNDVLELSRIVSGKLEIVREPVPLSELLRDTVAALQPPSAARRVRISLDPATGASLSVLADRARLKQAVLNLLSNTLRYSQPDAWVTLSWQGTASGSVRVSVNDRGLDVPAGKLGRLFEPFERLGAESTEVEGTGIGFALAKRLVQGMGGSVGADCQPGAGTTFWMELQPASPQPDRFEEFFAAGLAAAAAAVSQADHPVVLSIENDPPGLRLVEQILANRPQVRLVTTLEGAAGLELARLHRPLVILVGADLPDMDAGEILEMLKGDPLTNPSVLIAVSEDPSPLQEVRLRAAGAREYLPKPLDVHRLLNIVDKALKPSPAPAVVA